MQSLQAVLYRFYPYYLFSLLIVFSSPVAAQNKPAVAVRIAQALQQSIPEAIETIGTMQANESIAITPSISETVDQVLFEDAGFVEKGTLLVKLRAAEEEALLLEANSSLEEAKRQLDRVKPLVKQGAAPASLADERLKNYEIASARKAAIEARLNDRLLKAPFSGYVGLRQVSPGSFVQPGTIITTLDDTKTMKLDFSVASHYLPKLSPGLAIDVKSLAFPGKIFSGNIASLDSRIDPKTRMITVRAQIPNPEGILKPGLLMQVIIKSDPVDRLMVPEIALSMRSGTQYLYVVENLSSSDNQMQEGLAIYREVKTGLRIKGQTEILSGLKPGEFVVTHGTLKLRDKTKVTIAQKLNQEKEKS